MNQNSTGLSNFTATQNEVQCEDAQKPQPPETPAGCHTNDPDNPFGSALTQTQYGPIGMAKPLKHSQRRVGYSVHKTPGDSHQTGNLQDTFTVTQSSHQDNDTTSGQSNNVSGGVNTSGGGTVTQNTLIQGSGKTDVQAGTNTNVSGTINCPTGGSSCTKTLSAPKIVSKPNDPATFGSTLFTFKNVDPTVIFACSLDNAAYTTCTGGVQVNQTGALGTQNYSNLPSGQHTFSVKTKDAENGQLSSGADSFTWVITPPDPTITAKPSNPDSFGHSESFSFSDTDSTAKFKCSLDGGAYTLCTSGVSYPSLVSGLHSFSVQAWDQNLSYHSVNTADWSWVITPPDPTITAKPSNPDSFGHSESFSFSDTDSTAKFKCSLDGGAYTLCTSGVSYPGLVSGLHSFSVQAWDQNLSYHSVNTADWSWVITPPDPTISSGPDQPESISREATFAYADADSRGLFQCKLDDGAFVSCPSSGTSYTDLSLGEHTFTVKATDQTGTYESTGVATYTWTVIPFVSFEWTDDGAFAGWSAGHGSPIDLTIGSDPGTTYAQVTLHNFEGIALSDLIGEPAFTTDSYSGGSPRYEVDLSNGDYLFGYPEQAGFGSASWEVIHCDNSDCASVGFESWSDVQQSDEGSATVTDALVEADGGQPAVMDVITGLTFDGYTFN